MNFNEVLKDIEKLIGIQLESVKEGSGITIQNIDVEHENLQLLTCQNKLRSRPLVELSKIWYELQKSPAVHVDQVLGGSGTSRNQPETIMANLPYIEYAKIHGKKHLVFVHKATHPYGTLKQLDSTETARITALLDEGKIQNKTSVVIVSSNIKENIDYFQNISNGAVEAKEPGVYLLQSSSFSIVFITPSNTKLPTGTYPIVEVSNYVTSEPAVIIMGEEYFPCSLMDVTMLFRKK